MSEACDISVIVPCYNANRYLNICLESLKAQRVPNIEMIFIDDGSTDSTGAILDAFARAESRARVVHVRNEGVSAARNRGISMATGRYIAFVDADDVLEENALSILYQAAVKSGAQITSANHTLFDVERGCRVPVEIEPVVPQPSEIVREIIHMHRIYNNLWNKLYVRELFEDGLRLDESVHIGEDALLNLQLYLRAKTSRIFPITPMFTAYTAARRWRIWGFTARHTSHAAKHERDSASRRRERAVFPRLFARLRVGG